MIALCYPEIDRTNLSSVTCIEKANNILLPLAPFHQQRTRATGVRFIALEMGLDGFAAFSLPPGQAQCPAMVRDTFPLAIEVIRHAVGTQPSPLIAA